VLKLKDIDKPVVDDDVLVRGTFAVQIAKAPTPVLKLGGSPPRCVMVIHEGTCRILVS